MVSSDWLII